MQAGKLRHRVTIQQQGEARDADGGEIIAWIPLATVWAAVEPQSGQERHLPESDQLLASRLTRIRIRKRAGLDATMRVVFGSQLFDIQQVVHVETNNREMWLICEEKNV